MYKPAPRAQASQYRGVRADGKKWAAQITVNRKFEYLGLYASEEAAARAFDVQARKHGRETNF